LRPLRVKGDVSTKALSSHILVLRHTDSTDATHANLQLIINSRPWSPILRQATAMASSILILTLALTFWPAVVHSEIQEVRLECTPCFYVKHESVLDRDHRGNAQENMGPGTTVPSIVSEVAGAVFKPNKSSELPASVLISKLFECMVSQLFMHFPSFHAAHTEPVLCVQLDQSTSLCLWQKSVKD
jgi:hypothetical protein